MSKVHDDIIRDLLPLYIDNVCSAETQKMIEAHLASSSSLRAELEKLRTELQIPKEAAELNLREGQAIQAMSSFWIRSKTKAFMKGAALAVLSCAVLVLGYVGLFRWNITNVPADVIEISDVARLANGKIVYHIRLTDGYESNEGRYSYHEDGTIYITPKRPIIKTKAKVEIAISFYNTIDMFNYFYKEKYGADKQFSAVYYGTPEDRVLVWEKGMKVPPASAKAEAWFDPE